MRRFLRCGLLTLLIPLSSQGMFFDVNIPEIATGGIPYDVDATAIASCSDFVSIYIARDGEYFAYAEGTYIASTGAQVTDEYNPMGVEYWVQATSACDSTEEMTCYVDVVSRPPLGVFDSITGSVQRNGNVAMSGWAADYECGNVSSVEIYVGNVFKGFATLGGYRPDVQAASAGWQYWGYQDITYSGWSYVFNTTGLGFGTHSVRIMATDCDGASAEIGTREFTIVNTAPQSATVSTGGVTQLSLGQSLGFSGTLNDSDGNLTYHNLYYMSPGSGAWNGLLSGAPSNGTNSSLSASFTPSTIGVWSVHSNGHDAYGAWGPGATLAVNVVDSSAPSVPGGLYATGNTTGSSFTLNWGAASDNVGVVSYEVARDGSSLGTTAGTSFSVGSLAQVTTYGMTVRASDAAGNWSGWSSPLAVTTPDVSPPSTPTGIYASSVGGYSFTLNWNAAGDNVGVTAYEVARNGSSLGTTSGTSMAVGGLAEVTTYSMAVRARDAVGNWSAWSGGSNVTTADVSPPSVPTNLSASAVAGSSFTLHWNPSGDNTGVAAYEVLRNGVSLGTTAGTSLNISGLADATGYVMSVRARDASSNWSAWSGTITVTTPDVSAPSVPAGLGAGSISATSFTLSWSGSSDNVGVSGYEVYQNGAYLGYTGSTSWNCAGLQPLVSYSMAVRARDAVGNWSGFGSTSISTAADTTPPAAPSSLSANTVTISGMTLAWNASSDDVGVVGYNVYLNGGYQGSTGSTGFNVTGLSPATSYALTVKAADAAGNESTGSTINVTTQSDTVPPSAPTNLSVTGLTTTSFTLSWTAASDNVGVVGYDILRNDVYLITTTGTSYALSNQTPGSTVTMSVRAKDAASNTATANLAVTLSPPPSVTLTAPSVASLPGTLTLSASASPGSGSTTQVAKVEFYQGAVKLGESSSAPYSMEWSPKAVGPISLTARAIDTAGAWTNSSAVAVQLNPAFPYATGFEVGDGFSDATPHGIYGWEVAAGSATISASGSYIGTQSVVLNANATVPVIEREFAANSAAVAFVDFFSKPVAGVDVNSATTFDVDGAKIAFVANGASGRLHVLNGDGQGGGSWVALDAAIPLAGDGSAQAWVRISVRLDYSTKKWDLYLNGQMIAFDLRFRLDSASSFSWFSMKGTASANARLDAFYAGASNPLFTDLNNDGLPDDMDRYGDLDGDGLSNILEYVLGTNPNNADTDGDGIPDGWEHTRGLSPLNPADAGLDGDNDGLTNLQEFRTGRDILNPSDGATIPPGIQVKLRVPTNTYYQVTTSTWAITPDAGP